MNEPPDPGGTVPPPGSFITVSTSNVIHSNESSMDTDSSISQRKRSKAIKLCKHKRRRNIAGSEFIKIDCQCSDHSGNEKPVMSTSAVIAKPNSDSILSPLDRTNSQEARNLYQSTDISPYIVHVQRTQEHPDDNVTLHPVSFGMFLKKKLTNMALDSIINGSVKRIGRNKISLSFHHFEAANKFISNDSLGKNKLKAFIPRFHLTRMGIIRGVPNEWTEEQIIDNVVSPNGCGKIIKVRRINFKVIVDGSPTWKPSQSVVITFDGQVLPPRVFCCLNSLPVDLYIYPTVQCYNCCRFGHTKVNCRSKPRCYKCGHEHAGETCDMKEECVFCCLCSGPHLATSKACPEYNRQKQIKLTMAEKCMSYMEASKLFPAVSKSYADVLATTSNKTYKYDTIIQPQQLSSTSYKKTVFSKPRSQPRSPQAHGYDRVAQQNLVKDYNMPNPQDGCALKSNNSEHEKSVAEIIVALIKLLTNSNNIVPSNAAPILENIACLISNNNYGQQRSYSNSVELQKCDK